MSVFESLRPLPYFSELPDEDLQSICGSSREFVVARGDKLLEEGESCGSMYVVVDGEFEVARRAGNRDVVVGAASSGEVLGEMSLLEGRPASATARAVVPSRVVEIPEAALGPLLNDPGMMRAMLKTVTSRLRSTEGTLRQEEKMAALGKLTAGMMHELNNPSAAVARSADRLQSAMRRLNEVGAELTRQGIVPPPSPSVQELQLSPLERADREDEVGSWLEKRSVEDAWELAASLVARGWTAALLEESVAGAGDRDASRIATWLALNSHIEALAEEVAIASGRISEIVGAVKNYSRLDEAPIQEVDVHKSLDDTLRIFAHELKSGIEVQRDYEDGLPSIEGYASELNQVWTNLIDNAIDAMDEQGRLKVSTRSKGAWVEVEVGDTGPGMPEDVQGRIFDPFFTTKPPGQGTGLGLHTSYRIVARHGGEVRVRSIPGETVFTVTLPLRLEPASDTDQP